MAIRERERNRYEVVVYAGRDPVTGKERRVSRIVHGSKRKARDVERELIGEVRTTRSPAAISVGDLLDRWLAAANLEPSTAYQTRRMIDTKLRPRLGDVRLAKLTPSLIDQTYGSLQREGGAGGGPLSPGTVRRLHGVLSAACEYAVAWDWLDSNPAARAHPPNPRTAAPVPPDPDQVFALLQAAKERDLILYVALRLLASTGIRRGEVVALRWSDLQAGTLRIGRAMGQGEGDPYEKATKTRLAHTLALDTGTIEVLAAFRTNREALAARLDSELVAGAFILSHSHDGSTPLRPGVLTNAFVKLRRSLGLETVKLKDLRHFHATQLLHHGVNVMTVAGRLAHARPSTTLNFYTGWLASTDQEAARAIGQVLDG